MASTTHGFAFALTEGPNCLVRWGRRGTPVQASIDIEAVLRFARPLFVAFDMEASRKKRHRGQTFGDLLTRVCDSLGIMMLTVDGHRAKSPGGQRATKREVAEAMAKRFPETAFQLPARRRIWQSEDDRIGIFIALAAAATAWDDFRNPRRAVDRF